MARPFTRHLLVALSAHGFGHAAQAAAVVNALRQRLPDLRLTLRSLLPREFLARRFEGEFEYTSCGTDVGVVMRSALDVDITATFEAYVRFHAEWNDRVQQEALALARLAPDLVLADVPYLPLAAAARASIPAVALCSLNWADIYAHYFGASGSPTAATSASSFAIHAQILEAYNHAACFLQTEPHMPMTDLPRRRAIGPVARVGVDRRRELKEKLGVASSSRVVMITLGGIDLRLPFERWPSWTDVHWLVPAAWKITRPDATPIETLDMAFTDALRSVETLITKPGYGVFTEAACNGTPVLYVRRGNWPEEPYLIGWLERHGRCLEIDRQMLEAGAVLPALQKLWKLSKRFPVTPTGTEQAVKYLFTQWLGGPRAP